MPFRGHAKPSLVGASTALAAVVITLLTLLSMVLSTPAQAIGGPHMTLVFTNPSSVTLPLVDSRGDLVSGGGMTIDWGDGTTSSLPTHHYAQAGTYTVDVSASANVVGFGQRFAAPLTTLTAVTSWSGGWTSFAYAFNGATSLTTVPTSLPASVTTLDDMFQGATSFNQPLSTWQTSHVTSMSGTFSGATAFNQPLATWDTSAVTDMSYLFDGATTFDSSLFTATPNVTSMTFMFAGDAAFNQNIGGWDTASVTDMSYMFQNASSFDQPLDGWNVSAVTNMNGMFQFAPSFDQPVNDWTTTSLASMDYLFQQDSAFNQPVDHWNTSSVTSMIATFSGDTAFNQPLGSWDTSKVTSMNGMFANDTSFNSPLDAWSTGAVVDMGYMFLGASSFDQSLNDWSTSAVQTTSGMFELASSFNQPLNRWDMSAVATMAAMFLGDTAFNSPLFTSTQNVTDMSGMFQGATAFDQSVATLATDHVTTLSGMFAGATMFNAPLFSNVSNVTSMSYVFAGATSFDQPLGNWDTSQVTDMSYAFEYASAFDQPLASWNVTNVTTLDGAFSYATSFNQPLNTWQVSNVVHMSYLFQGASAFNQPLDSWNTASVLDMSAMFASATSFNQPLDAWNTANVTDMSYLFQGASVFAQNIAGWRVTAGTDVTDRCQGVITCNQRALDFRLSGAPLGGFVNAYGVTLVIPQGAPAPTGTATISDNGVPVCSTSQWRDGGPSGSGGEAFTAQCTDLNTEAAGDLIVASYQGGGNQDPTSPLNYGTDYGVASAPSLLIPQVTLYVVPDAQAISYGDAAPNYTFSYHLNAPTGPLLSTSVLSEPFCQSNYDGTWNAGTYATAISCSGGYDTNFVFDTSATAPLTIAPILLYVVPDAQSVNYGDPVPAYTYNFFTGSPTGSPASVSLAVNPTCSSSYGPSTNVPDAPLTISCAPGHDPNYLFDVSTTAQLVISPDTVVVVPDDQAMTYGDAIPTYTFSYHLSTSDGALLALTPASVPVCSSSYTSSTSVASAPLLITCSGGRDPNYVFDTSVAAQLSIVQAQPSVSIVSVNKGATFGTSYDVRYLLTPGDVGNVTLTSSNPSCEVSGLRVTFSSGTGVCVLTVAVESDVNFLSTEVTQQLTLNKVTLIVTPAALTIPALSVAPAYGFSYHLGSVAGPVVSPPIASPPVCTSSFTSTTPATASPVLITCTQGADLNYAFDVSATSTLTITRIAPAPLVITSVTSGVAGTPLTLSASGGSGTVTTTFGVVGKGCAVVAGQLTASGAADCVVTARTAETGYYESASSAPLTVHFAWAQQSPLTITSTVTAVAGNPVTVTASGGSGVRALVFHATGVGCVLTGTTLTATTGTSCVLTAVNPGNGIYSSVTSPPVAVTFTYATQSAVSLTSPTVAVVGTPLTLTATGGKGIKAYHFAVTSGTCAIRGGVLMSSHTGTCVVTATNAGSGIYAPMQSLPVTITVAPANSHSLYVLFAPAATTLTLSDQASLQRFATALIKAKATSVSVTGYINAGDGAFASQRAQATATYLAGLVKNAGASITVNVATAPAQLKYAFGLNAVFVTA